MSTPVKPAQPDIGPNPDEVLRRMLSTPPKEYKPKPAPADNPQKKTGQ